MANMKASVEITAVDRASKVIGNVRQELLGMSSLGSRLGAVASPLGAIAGGIAALGAGAALLRNFVGAIDDLADTAEGLGTTAVALAEMRSKAAEAGVEAGTLDNAIGKLNNKIGDAVAGNEKATALFKAMGVAFKDVAGNARPTEQVLADVADRMRTYANTAEKAALVSELFGEKIGRKLVAYLNQGSEGLRQFTGLTDETIKEAGDLQREIDKLANSWERLKNSVLGAAVPAINKLIDAFRGGSTEQKISEVERIIRSMEHAAVGSSKNLEMYREELKRLKAELSDESVSRFLSGGGAARRVDAPVLAPKLPEIEKTKRAVQELARVTDEYAASLRRAVGEEANRRGVEEINALAAAERRRVDELDRLAEMEGRLTTAQKERLLVIEQLRGRVSDEQINKLTLDVYGLADATAAAKDAAADFGFTFTSALENVIIEGGKASDVIRALEQDILRMVTRRMVTEPLGNAVSGFFGRAGGTLAGGGSFFDAIADGMIKIFGMSSGGHVMGGRPYIVGEKGPELFVPGQSGGIVPNGRIAGNVINITVAGSATRETANQIAGAVGRQLAIAGARGFA